ncbi:hypothetical protein [Peptostreptococcus russellii]|uniref:Uncharacterized protein n=1 Tax=Peptostreptococcus russellii TaxID=215200 RepID=A0A1H8EMQ3_9FIRM|nr:hypothetical protein [Peptostreptococcus russellii]SEN20167.1 hypothetical protein SAMN05216454_101163 [Peptostreptococcus russellii]
MKKNLFAIMVVLAGALSISPLSIALENTEKEDNLPDVMYVSNQNTEVDGSLTEDSNNNENVNTDSNIANDKFAKSDEEIRNSSDKIGNTNQNMQNEKKYTVRNNENINTSDRNSQRQVSQARPYSSNKTNQYSATENTTVNQNVNSNAENKSLNRDEALQILKDKNNKCDYDYMGDENTFNVLKEKGQEGYVFVPDVQTDLGLFVNKNTKEVYTFHPSGSLDIY